MPPTLTFSLEYLKGQSPVRKRAEVVLELRTRSGEWERQLFRVDSGASLCTMSYRRAGPPTALDPKALDLATGFAERRVDRTLADGSTQVAVPMFPGTLTARFPEQPAFVFRWECLFDPLLPPAGSPLLGIGGSVLSDLTVTFRGPSREHPGGAVSFDVLVRPVPLFPPSDPLVRECRYEPAGWPPVAPNPPASP